MFLSYINVTINCHFCIYANFPTNNYICYFADIIVSHICKKTKKKRGDKMSEKAHLSIRIPKRLMKDIKILAIEREQTLTNVVRTALEEYIEENKK